MAGLLNPLKAFLPNNNDEYKNALGRISNGNPMGLLDLGGAIFNQASHYLGDKTLDATGSPALATGAYMIPQAVGAIAGGAEKAFGNVGAGIASRGVGLLHDGMMGKGLLGDALSGIAPMKITAYHGSPHTFDNFDMSKIGTGEGAQAYGHGLYFAESPDVAKAYRSNLVKDGSYLEKSTGKIISKEMPEYTELIDRQSRMERNGYGADFDKKYQIQEGGLYKVDIPDDHIAKMLDWDKPLSEQHPDVMNAIGINPQDANKYNNLVGRMDELQNIKGGLDSNEWNNLLDQAKQLRAKNNLHTTGENYYKQIAMDSVGRNGASYNHNKEAATALQLQGLTGIRYLDGGSRTAGQGSSNFVVFDDKIPKILERNSQPMGLLK